jgi:hypothetical protein
MFDSCFDQKLIFIINELDFIDLLGLGPKLFLHPLNGLALPATFSSFCFFNLRVLPLSKLFLGMMAASDVIVWLYTNTESEVELCYSVCFHWRMITQVVMPRNTSTKLLGACSSFTF